MEENVKGRGGDESGGGHIGDGGGKKGRGGAGWLS